MRKLMLLLCLAISPICNAQLTVGYLTGFHVGTPELSNQHPFIEISDTVLIYKNSFDKLSVAGYYKISKNNFTLRAGVTSGYSERMRYKNKTYKINTISKNILLFLVPSIEIKKNNITYVAAILGNSFNIGVGFSF